MTTTTEKDYSETGFWDKLKHYALKAGSEVVEKALWLYYAAQQPATPAWAKTVIYGALAYFILPFDAIPDFIPIAGYTDDLGALATALVTVSMYVTEDVKEPGAGEEGAVVWVNARRSADLSASDHLLPFAEMRTICNNRRTTPTGDAQ